MPIAPLRHALRTVAWWPSCRCRGIRARRVPCAPAGAIAWQCRLTSATASCTPCDAAGMARGLMRLPGTRRLLRLPSAFWGLLTGMGPRALGMTLGVPSFDRYWAYRFMHALGSPNVYGADGACEVSRLTGWEHSLGYSPASDLAHTDCIMYLGRSIVDSSTMGAVDALNDARRRGAKIIVVDPRRSGSAALADRWLRVRPGLRSGVAAGHCPCA